MPNTIKIFFIAFLIIIGKFNSMVAQTPPNWQWAKNANGTNDEGGDCIAVDGSGNVFVAGHFYSSTISFGTYTLNNAGNYDIYVVKYSPFGNVLWAKGGGGIYHDYALDIVTDAAGNVYVTGAFYSPTIVLNSFTLTSLGAGDAYLIKYDASGNEVWAKNIGGNYNDSSNGITADQSGNIYVTGSFDSDSIVCGTFTLTNTGAGDVFTAKYDGAGNVIWAKSMEGANNDIGNGIAVDANQNVFVTGEYSSASLIIDSNTLTSIGSNDIFISKYDALGNEVWSKTAGGTFNDRGTEITLDIFGNVFVGGDFNSTTLTVGTMTFANLGNFDFFISKYSNAGNLLWAKAEGDIMDEVCTGLATDPGGELYVTGHFHGPSLTLGTYTLNNNGAFGGDLYVTKYTASGNNIWALSVGGGNDDGSSCLTIDQPGNLYVGGFFSSPTITCSAITLTSTGGADMFVGKLASTFVATNLNNASEIIENTISVYPNPSTGLFQIHNKESVIGDVEIFNNLGELIYKSNYSLVNNSVIDLSNKPKGIYFIKISSSNAMTVKKVVIQ